MEGLGFWLASEAITNASIENNVTYGITSRQADANDELALQRSVADKIRQIMGDDATLFISTSWNSGIASIFVFGSASHLIPTVHENLLKYFGTRLSDVTTSAVEVRASLSDWKMEDETLLLDALKSSISPTTSTAASIPEPPSTSSSKHIPPPGAQSIDQILESARSRLTRISPHTAHSEVTSSSSAPTILVDIRPEAQRRANGHIPGALIIERNVLEWRLDPQSDARLKDVVNQEGAGYGLRVIVFCQEGYTSSLAAASLLDLGLSKATDIEGGYRRWKEEGLPVEDA